MFCCAASKWDFVVEVVERGWALRPLALRVLRLCILIVRLLVLLLVVTPKYSGISENRAFAFLLTLPALGYHAVVAIRALLVKIYEHRYIKVFSFRATKKMFFKYFLDINLS